jgi:predicted  nucleic acid-binding Zn-ribbon protein
MRRPDHRQGTFAGAYDAMASTHDRMAENGIEFANELHRMHDELIELANVAERSRKQWKANGLSAENKVSEMEQTMRKSKTKYDSLAEDYEKAKMGEARQSGKMFGALKGHKSAAQHEEDLLKKVQAADQTYKGHVQALQTEKAQLVSSTRPEAVKNLQESIREIDAGVAMQMQKFGMSAQPQSRPPR